MGIISKELLHFNRKMKIVALVIGISAVLTLFFLWRYMEQKSMGENAAYKAPMHVYSAAEKLMVREKFDKALKKYARSRKMLEAIKGIDLTTDFYYAIVNNAIGTVHLRLGVYGNGDKPIRLRSDLGRNSEEIKLALEYFNQSVGAYKKWLKLHRPGAKELAALAESRKGVAEDKIEMRPFERYERALSVSLTNCGLAWRYLNDFDRAQNYYNEALVLWSQNRTAKHNLEDMEKVLAEEAAAARGEKLPPAGKSEAGSEGAQKKLDN
jgi:tetratricopeptide (TPR) repeat protein